MENETGEQEIEKVRKDGNRKFQTKKQSTRTKDKKNVKEPSMATVNVNGYEKWTEAYHP